MGIKSKLHEIGEEIFPTDVKRGVINIAVYESVGVISRLDPNLSRSAADTVSGTFGALGLACMYKVLREKRRSEQIAEDCDYTKFQTE